MKKVLIITYHWPPAGGPGVQRILKFAKYLPQYGWKPLILTVAKGEYLAYDSSLETEIDQNMVIFRTKTLEPFSLYKRVTHKKKDEIIPNLILTEQEASGWREKLSRWIRTNVFIPDARVGWIPYLVHSGRMIIAREKPDLIFSSSPPHSVQIGAMRLARHTGIKWIADFRDLWFDLDIFYQYNKRNLLSQELDAYLEQKVLERVDAFVSINNYIVNLLNEKLPFPKPAFVIPSGYDGKVFQEIRPGNSDVFTITYAGTLSESRIPEVLITAMQKFLRSGIINIRLQLIGTVCARCINLLQISGVIEVTRFENYLPYAKLVEKLADSSVLLLVIDNVPHNEGYLSGKIFDYLGIKKPIFAIGPPRGAANDLISETDSGEMVGYQDHKGAFVLLQDLYKDWQNKTSRFTFNSGQYEKSKLTRQLAAAFDQVIDSVSRP